MSQHNFNCKKSNIYNEKGGVKVWQQRGDNGENIENFPMTLKRQTIIIDFTNMHEELTTSSRLSDICVNRRTHRISTTQKCHFSQLHSIIKWNILIKIISYIISLSSTQPEFSKKSSSKFISSELFLLFLCSLRFSHANLHFPIGKKSREKREEKKQIFCHHHRFKDFRLFYIHFKVGWALSFATLWGWRWTFVRFCVSFKIYKIKVRFYGHLDRSLYNFIFINFPRELLHLQPSSKSGK